MNPHDHYTYWNQQRDQRARRLLHREIITLNILKSLVQKGNCLLDVGCGDGRFMEQCIAIESSLNIQGIDFSHVEVASAAKRGLAVKQGNVQDGLPYSQESFDIIHAAELIEHLYDADQFLIECNQALKTNGYLIISTPNLCAWFNRIFLPLGIQPLFLEPSTRSKKIGSGILGRFKKEDTPVGHVRIFTILALKDMLARYEFELIQVKGAIFDEGLPRKMWWLDHLFAAIKPSLASNLILVAKKKTNVAIER